MSSRTISSAGGGRNPRCLGLWMCLLGWHVFRVSPQAAFDPSFMDPNNWREAYEAGMTPAQAYATHRTIWER
jgi:hypothetical protein